MKQFLKTLNYRTDPFLKKLSISFLLSACLCSAIGCSPALEKTAEKLQPGMTTKQVYSLFSGYEVMASRTGNVAHISRDAVVFRSDIPVASSVTFAPRARVFHNFETCKVYFGSDGVVLGYYYELPH